MAMDLEAIFGRWLRRRRTALGLTQKALARRADCSPATVRKIEAEQRRPSAALATRIATALGLEDPQRTTFVDFARRGWSEAAAAALGPPSVALPWPTHAGTWAAGVVTDPEPESTEHDARAASEALFVARDAQLERLAEHLEAALEGRGGVVFVTGEPGSGKSALMAEFARRAEGVDPTLLCATGACEAFAGFGDPYLPFRDLIGALCGEADRNLARGPGGARRALRLREALPYTLGALLEQGPHLVEAFLPVRARARRELANDARSRHHVLAAPEGRPEAQTRRELFDAYARLLDRVAERHPLLLVVDDLQWVDAASVDLLFHLARRLDRSRVLILGAYRRSEVARPAAATGDRAEHPLAGVVHELVRRFGDIRIDLDGVDDRERRTFVDALVDAEPNALGEPFRAALLRHTGGHPLFAVELLRSMQARGDLPRDEHGRRREGTALDWKALPARVEAVIASRVARLGDALRGVLAVASVEGESFTAEVVARVLGAALLDLVRGLSNEAERAHALVRELERDPAGSGGSRFRFAHALFRQYLYDGLGTAERRLLHGRVADALLEEHGADADDVAAQLAHHFAEAGEAARAARFHALAGERALRLAALGEAARHYRAAAGGWPPTDRSGRLATLRRLAECLWMLGDLREALATSEEARAEADAIGDAPGGGAIERQIGRLHWELGDRMRSLEHYRRALAILELEPPGVELARALSSVSQMHMLASEYDDAVAWGERARDLAERLGAADVVVHALCNIGVARADLGEHAVGIDLLRRSAREAARLGLPHDAGRALNNLCEILLALCRHDEARVAIEELRALADRAGVSLFVATARILATALDWRVGAWRNALDRTPSVLAGDAWARSGHLLVVTSTLRATLWNDVGRPDRALQELDGSRAAALASDELQLTVPHTAQLLRARAASGMDEGASECAAEIRSWVERTPYVEPGGTTMALLFACRWSARSLALDAARACLRQIERADRQLATPETAAAATEARGVVAVAASDAAGAGRWLGASGAMWRTVDRPLDELRALESLEEAAGALLGAGLDDGVGGRLRALTRRLAAQLDEAELRRAFLETGRVGRLPSTAARR